MKIDWHLVEGGEKGLKVKMATQAVINKFFSIGVKNIQDECNEVANKYRTLWSAKPPSDLMNECDIQVTYAGGCRELEPEFKLFEPASIIIKMLDCHWPFKGSVAASLDHSIQDSMNPLLAIFLKELELRDSTVIWKGFSLSFECIVNHELLHACGDSPRLRHDVHDGIIRHNMICSEAINNLARKL